MSEAFLHMITSISSMDEDCYDCEYYLPFSTVSSLADAIPVHEEKKYLANRFYYYSDNLDYLNLRAHTMLESSRYFYHCRNAENASS